MPFKKIPLRLFHYCTHIAASSSLWQVMTSQISSCIEYLIPNDDIQMHFYT